MQAIYNLTIEELEKYFEEKNEKIYIFLSSYIKKNLKENSLRFFILPNYKDSKTVLLPVF